MKSQILLAILLLFINTALVSQQELVVKKDKPVRSPFETAILIDFPTTKTPVQGALELLIHHRFGMVNNGITDIFGIYAPSNIMLTLNYGITDNITIGFGSEKNNKIQEFHGKWTFLNQTRSGAIPVSLSYYGVIGLDARNADFFGANYRFINRLSYFNQLIISRKFTADLSLQTAVSYSHFNTVDELVKNDHLGFHLAGRYKIWSSNSFIFEYTLPLGIGSGEEENTPKQGLSAGIEFGSSTHGFQLIVSNYNKLNPQLNVGTTQNDFIKGEVSLGFNITVRF